MRKFMRKFRNVKFRRIFIISFILIIGSIITFAYAQVFTHLNVYGTAAKLFVKDYNVSYEYTIYSTNPYNVDALVTVTSLTSEYTDSWEIFVDLPEGATNVNAWGAVIAEHSGTKYHLVGNSDLPSKQSVTFHIAYTSANGYELQNGIVYGLNENGQGLGGLGGGGNEDPDPTVITDPCEGKFVHDDDPIRANNGALSATLSTTNSWTSNGKKTYAVNINIANSSNAGSAWVVILKVNGDANPICWNGTCSLNDGNLVIQPPSYASSIPANSDTDFSFQIDIADFSKLDLVFVGKLTSEYVIACQPDYNGSGSSSDPGEPDEPDDPIVPPVTSNLSAVLNLGNSWNSGSNGLLTYSATLVVTNTGTTTVNNWTVVLGNCSNADMTGCWNGTCTKSGSQITLNNSTTIAPGRSVEITYQITKPQNVNVTVVSAS